MSLHSCIVKDIVFYVDTEKVQLTCIRLVFFYVETSHCFGMQVLNKRGLSLVIQSSARCKDFIY